MVGGVMGEPVQITLADVWHELRQISERLSDYKSGTDLEVQKLKLEAIDQRRDHAELKAKFEESEKVRIAAQSRALWALVTALIFPLIVAVATVLMSAH
jgi:hypothetical protein